MSKVLWKFFQEGIEQVHNMHMRTIFRVHREERVTEDSGELF
jgi:hypothetical protein